MPTFNDSVKQIGKSDATSMTTVSLVNVRAKFYNEIDISNEVYTQLIRSKYKDDVNDKEQFTK